VVQLEAHARRRLREPRERERQRDPAAELGLVAPGALERAQPHREVVDAYVGVGRARAAQVVEHALVGQGADRLLVARHERHLAPRGDDAAPRRHEGAGAATQQEQGCHDAAHRSRRRRRRLRQVPFLHLFATARWP
jgi:hypothetical protein